MLFMIYFGFLSQVRFATEHSWCPGRSRNATCDFPAAPDVGRAWNLQLRKSFLHTAARAGIQFVPCLNNSQLSCAGSSACFCSSNQNISWVQVWQEQRASPGSGLLLSPADVFSRASSCGILLKVILTSAWLLWVKMGSLQQGRFVPFWLPHSPQNPCCWKKVMQKCHALAALSQTWTAAMLHFSKNNPNEQKLPAQISPERMNTHRTTPEWIIPHLPQNQNIWKQNVSESGIICLRVKIRSCHAAALNHSLTPGIWDVSHLLESHPAGILEEMIYQVPPWKKNKKTKSLPPTQR